VERGDTDAAATPYERSDHSVKIRPSRVKTKRVNFALLGLLCIISSGCSTETYRHWADADVQKMLHEDKQQTLGYQPVTVVDDPSPKMPAPDRALAEIPATTIVPPQSSAVEPRQSDIPHGPLGPELKWMRDWPTPTFAPDLGVAAVERKATDRVRLGPPSPFAQINRFDLFNSLGYGIQHSRQYQDQLETLYETALTVTLQHHLLLEPQPFATSSLEYNGGQFDVATRSAMTATETVGVNQPLPYGGQVSASALVQFVDALDNQAVQTSSTTPGVQTVTESVGAEASQISLSANVPLLRGAGTANLEPYIQSQRQLIYQVRAFENYRRNFVVTVASQYFRLLTSLQAVNSRRVNYNNSRDTLEQTEALFAADRINFLEVQRAQQEVLDSQTDLINAQASYEESVDLFKLVLGMPVEQELEIVPVALEVPVPKINSEQAMALAERYRLDLQTARDQIDDAHRQIGVAENGLLPDLNLNASTSVGNRFGTPAKSLDSRTLAYNAGITLNFPVDRLAQRNVYRTALINFAQAQRSLVDQTESVKSAVRDNLRLIQAAELNLEIQRRGIDLAQRRLEYATELLRLGQQSSSRDQVEAQQSLLSAQDGFEQAKSDLQVNVLLFLQTTGTLRVDPHAGTLGEVLNQNKPMNDL
jgi:outer membrane protein TolC